MRSGTRLLDNNSVENSRILFDSLIDDFNSVILTLENTTVPIPGGLEVERSFLEKCLASDPIHRPSLSKVRNFFSNLKLKTEWKHNKKFYTDYNP